MESTTVPTNARIAPVSTLERIVTTNDRVACRIEDLPQDLVDDIINAKMDPKFDYLNDLLQEGLPKEP